MTRLLLIYLFIFVTIATQARGKYDNTDTLFVDQHGTTEFQTVNQALEVCRAFMEYKKVIYIKKGIYKEKVIVPSWLTNIEIVGEDKDSTVITYADHANIPSPSTGKPMGTFRTFTVRVDGTNITFKNLTIENNAPRLGQAVALHTEGTRLAFVNCKFLGNQDTIYTGRPYTYLLFKDCYIEGTTDFIFGPSTAWFEGCEIFSKINSYITAASTPEDAPYGYVFCHCRLTAADSVDHVYLGRPWRAFAYTLFMKTTMGTHIVPEGWHNWKDYHDPATEGTVRYYEYKNSGKGAASSAQRVNWAKQLPADIAEKITPDVIFNGDTDWLP